MRMKYVRNIALAGLVGVEKFILVGRILINNQHGHKNI